MCRVQDVHAMLVRVARSLTAGGITDTFTPMQVWWEYMNVGELVRQYGLPCSGTSSVAGEDSMTLAVLRGKDHEMNVISMGLSS